MAVAWVLVAPGKSNEKKVAGGGAFWAIVVLEQAAHTSSKNSPIGFIGEPPSVVSFFRCAWPGLGGRPCASWQRQNQSGVRGYTEPESPFGSKMTLIIHPSGALLLKYPDCTQNPCRVDFELIHKLKGSCGKTRHGGGSLGAQGEIRRMSVVPRTFFGLNLRNSGGAITGDTLGCRAFAGNCSGRGNGLGGEASSSGMQIGNVGRFIGPAAQGRDSTEESAITNTATRHRRDGIRAGL